MELTFFTVSRVSCNTQNISYCNAIVKVKFSIILSKHWNAYTSSGHPHSGIDLIFAVSCVSCNTQNNSYCNAIITVQFSVTLSHDAGMHIVGTSTQWNCPNLCSQSRQLKYTNISYCNTTVEFRHTAIVIVQFSVTLPRRWNAHLPVIHAVELT